MTINMRNVSMFAVMALLFLAVGLFQSWTLSLTILNLCLISAIMSLGVNIQWGYGGLLNVGVMGFAALGGATGCGQAGQPGADNDQVEFRTHGVVLSRSWVLSRSQSGGRLIGCTIRQGGKPQDGK